MRPFTMKDKRTARFPMIAKNNIRYSFIHSLLYFKQSDLMNLSFEMKNRNAMLKNHEELIFLFDVFAINNNFNF